MAYVSNDPDLEEEKQDQPNSSQGTVSPVGGAGGAVHLSPPGGVAAVGGAGTPSGAGASGTPSAGAATSTPSQAGGQFGSLNQYLTANQGQAAPLAGKITSGINNQYNNLNNQDTSTLAGINQQVSANAAPSQDQTNATIAQESANPVSFTSNPGNVASFQNLLNASYAGPVSAESTAPYQAQQNAVNSAISAGQNAVGTEAGRENLLTQNEATPTTGVTALNSAILSQDPNALNSIETAYQPFSGLLNNLQTGAASADQQIAANQANATSDQSAANSAINNQITALNNNVNTEYGNLQNQYNTATGAETALTSGLQNGALPAGYGVDPGLQQFITNNINPWVAADDPGQSVSYNFSNAIPQLNTTAAPTIGQAATTQDYAQAQAFQNLLNGVTTGAPSMIINPATANQAGTYKAPIMPAVNNQALAGDIAGGLGQLPGNVAAGPYQSYLALLAALQNYQGLPIGGNAPNPGTQIPTIS